MVNKWFILPDIGLYRKKSFSCFTSTNQSSIRFNILDLNFKIAVELQWFAFSWRRRDGEDISYLSAHCEISIPCEDILEIPFFKSTITETDEIEKMKAIERLTEENLDVKQALIERFGKDLGKKIYTNIGENTNISVLSERYCGDNDIDENYCAFAKTGDDTSQLKNIRSCIINAY